MSAFDPSQQSPAVRLRMLIESIGLVAREPGCGKGYSAIGGVEFLEHKADIELWIPPQDEQPMQVRIGSDAAGLIVLDGSSGTLQARDWKTEEALPPTTAFAALDAAERLLAKVDALRCAWVARVDRAAGERIIRAFFSPWPQSLGAALATFDRQLSSAPIRRPMEMDNEDPGIQIWLAVFAEGHERGLRLVDFVRERDPTWIADRFREQPEPTQATTFRAAREKKLSPASLAVAIDRHLAAVGWRLVMFDIMYGKPMPAELAQQVMADAPAAGLGSIRIELGGDTFRRN